MCARHTVPPIKIDWFFNRYIEGKSTIIYSKMDILCENLYKKRFCLNVNEDVSNYINGDKHVHKCLCGPYNHVACVLKGKER
jgi:hypothetical protein